MDFFVNQRLLVQGRRLPDAREFPACGVGVLLVVALALAVRCLVFLAEVATAGLVAHQGVVHDQLGQFQVIGHAARAFERLVEVRAFARHVDVLPEFFPQRRNLGQRFLQALFGARHPAMLPQDPSEPFVEFRDCRPAADGKEFLDAVVDLLFGLLELTGIGLRTRAGFLGREIIADGVGENEITVRQPLHQGAGAETVRAVVREIGLADDERARQVAH